MASRNAPATSHSRNSCQARSNWCAGTSMRTPAAGFVTNHSYGCIDVFGTVPDVVDDIVRRLRHHGEQVVERKDVQLAEAPADGVFPPDFYVTTNQQTFVHLGSKWIEVQPATMDCAIAVD